VGNLLSPGIFLIKFDSSVLAPAFQIGIQRVYSGGAVVPQNLTEKIQFTLQ
jgi:hypothetical protein